MSWSSKMRASFWVIGPLLARDGRSARVAARRLRDRHASGGPVLEGLTALGAQIDIEAGLCQRPRARGRPARRTLRFPKVSVGATHVMMMAATLGAWTTVIDNAAREPEVVDLANCLNAMGARSPGAGTSKRSSIEGVTSLAGARHRVLPDRIETGTYAMAVAMTGGDVVLENTSADLLHTALTKRCADAGAEITDHE
jgi:UDP-N-acetylglucosamine 1-carboxyvinyltransferase